METEISRAWAPRDVVNRNDFLTVSAATWHNIVFSYEMFDGRRTEAKYYLNDELMKHENLDGEIIIDDINRIFYVGAEHQIDGTFTHLCNSCVYDLYIYQDHY